MVRDIDQETVDFVPNYDGKTMQPDVLPSRFPNLLVNGSAGIAVGMATRSRRTTSARSPAAVQWHLAHPEASREQLLEESLRVIKGPGLPDRRADHGPQRASRTPTAPGAARSSCGPSSRSRRSAVGSASS